MVPVFSLIMSEVSFKTKVSLCLRMRFEALLIKKVTQNGDSMNIHFRDVQTGMVEARAIIEIEPGVFLNEVTLLNIDGQLVVEFPRKNFVGKYERTHHLDIITFESEDKQVLWEVQIKQAYRDWRKDNRKVLVYEDKPEPEPGSEEPPRRQYKERTYEDRPPRDSSFAGRDQRGHTEGERPRRAHDDSRERKPYSSDRPYREKRSFDDKPRSEDSYVDRKPRSESSYGDRKPRAYADRDSRPRTASRPYGDKPENRDKPYRERSGFSDRPTGEKRTYGDKPDREKRSYSDRPRRESSPRADKPAYDKPYRERPPRQDKPAYDKPARGRFAASDRPTRERSAGSDRPKREYKPAGTVRARKTGSDTPKPRRVKKQD
jgi:hypothetical protein